MKLSWPEIRANAARFSEEHAADHYEKGQTHAFYEDFFRIFGVDRKQVAVYERRVDSFDKSKRGFIDLFWPGTLLVEQKSAGLDLGKAGAQAFDYYDGLPEVQKPRYILTCDFQRFRLLDLESAREWRFPLADLKRHVEAFSFIVGPPLRLLREQPPVNKLASALMGRLHEALAADGFGGHDLERLLVRLLFILFADKTGIFNTAGQFGAFLEQRTGVDGRDLGRWLGELFDVLDTHPRDRQAGLDPDLADFPYINGGLFAERIRMASFDNAMRAMLLDACAFDWSAVSPAIFGSLFESVIDRVTQRRQGAHYTPEDAILKVIGPLFLDDLRSEFDRLRALKSGRDRALRGFHDRLGALRFLDPACGAGNFLVVAYRELRELERELLKELTASDPETGLRQTALDVADLSRLDVSSFCGIEIDEFPARIAEVALWMTDHIANRRLGEDVGRAYARIPLVTAPGIVHADALEVDWNAVLPAADCSYVLGNPPFAGQSYQSSTQREQMRALLKALGGKAGSLDYVSAWFLKAGAYVQDGDAQIGFVATNSITQGEQVAQLWPHLFRMKLELSFAHRTFVWTGRAAVHCVVVGLARRGSEPAEKRLFTYPNGRQPSVETRHSALTAYLFDATEADRHLVVKEARKPAAGSPTMRMGSKIVDGGHYIFDPIERSKFLLEEPSAEALMLPLIGAKEFIQGGKRWILDLQDVPPDRLRELPHVRDRIRRVRSYRASSTKSATRELADKPLEYEVNTRPQGNFLVVPKVSSERRDYVPIGWAKEKSVPSDLVQIVETATSWHFGVLTSRMHMSWLRHMGGRLKSDYRYSIGLVYNTFPWPADPTPAQVSAIEALAQAVLDARALDKNDTSTLADLYDPDTMPAELRRAHRDLDLAVDRLYRRAAFASDRERVEHLFTLYQRLADPLPNEGVRQNKRVSRRAARAD